MSNQLVFKSAITTSRRLFSRSAYSLVPSRPTNAQGTGAGTFKTFAEYRANIVKKDPEIMKARKSILISDGKAEELPESKEEDNFFKVMAKEVAYN